MSSSNEFARQWHDNRTAAVSNVEPNTVQVLNSKDKTNDPISGISPFEMVDGNLREDREKFALFKTISPQVNAAVHTDHKYCYCKENIYFASVLIYSSSDFL